MAIGYSYDAFDSGLDEVEAMYGNASFEDMYADYPEPDFPNPVMPTPTISSSVSEKTNSDDENSDKDKKKTSDNANNSKKKETEKKENSERPSEDKEKKEDKKPEDNEEMDDLILDKKGCEKEPEMEQEDVADPQGNPIKYVCEDLGFEDNTSIPISGKVEEKVSESPSDEVKDEIEEEPSPAPEKPDLSPEEPQERAQEEEVYTEPYEEVVDVMDVDDFREKYGPVLVKVLAFVAMLLVIIGIPVFLSSLKNRDRSREETTEMTKVEAAVTVTSDNGDYYESIGKQSYKTLEMTNKSSRFENLDELSFYLESNINATLSNEQALYNTYTSGNCSKAYFIYNLNEYIEFTDEMSHLLTANKSLYKEEGKEERYYELSDSLDVLMVYGDTIK